jgi:hypothetical protein
VLQIGALGCLGLGLPDALRAADRGSKVRARSVIFLHQFGGASHHDTFDMKPDAPAEIRGEFKPIPTSVPGLSVCEHLPRLARLADRYCLVRSFQHLISSHN